MLDRAIAFAAAMHEGQFDKGGEPYILHCLAVMMKVPKEYRVIAVLHDVVEDCGVNARQLVDLGLEMWEIESIFTLTKYEGLSYEEYVEGVLSNVPAMHVKMADLEHNSDIRRLKGVTEKDIARIIKYQEFYSLIKERLDV